MSESGIGTPKRKLQSLHIHIFPGMLFYLALIPTFPNICFTIDVDNSKAKNFTTYVLIVKLETGVKKEKIYKEIKNKFGNIWATVGPVQPSIAFFMYSRSLSQIEDVVERVKMITEVKTANIALYASFHRFTGWYDKKIDNMTKK